MNPKNILILSVGLNVLLLAFLLRPDRTAPTATAQEPSTARGNTGSAIHGLPERLGSQSITNTLVREITWEQVESPDYREYIANLRAIGCPEETIRDIILADVNKLYEEKKKAARGEPRRFEFWKAGNPMGMMLGDPETLQQMRALEEEKLGVLRALGIEPDPMQQIMTATGGNPMDRMFDFLSDSKRADVMKLMTEFQARMVERSQDGVIDGEAMLKAQHEMEQAIRQVLTPQEFLDYQLRFSMTANTMRTQLAGFDPSEEEFLAIFQMREAFDREHSPFFGFADATEEEQRQRHEAHLALEQQIRDTLGPDRFAEYQRAQDHEYQQLRRVVQRAELPVAVANEVHDMRRVAEHQASSVRQNPNLSGDQRSAALLAIRRETEQSMRQALGDDVWQQYNRPNNLWWLRNIASEESEARTVVHPPFIDNTVIHVAP
jgi:hypothetical protein